MSARQLKIFQKFWFLLEGTRAFGRKLTENFTYLNTMDCTDLPSEMLTADSQMTTSFFMLQS
jgi:hypothetical protein